MNENAKESRADPISTMTNVADITQFLEEFAPLRLAEDWDNVGLLVGDRSRPAERVMTCLTVTPASAKEAIGRQADLIVTHHPLPFRSLKRITPDTSEGRLLWDLIGAQIAIFSPHTAFDSAAEGINQRLAEGLALNQIAPLAPAENETEEAGGLGSGRFGQLDEAMSLAELAERVKQFLHIDHLHLVGDPQGKVRQVAVACGSAGEFLQGAVRLGCECLVIGETQFHTCLEAEARGVGLLLTGHFASERFAVELLAEVLTRQFAETTVWASREERDPIQWV